MKNLFQRRIIGLVSYYKPGSLYGVYAKKIVKLSYLLFVLVQFMVCRKTGTQAQFGVGGCSENRHLGKIRDIMYKNNNYFFCISDQEIWQN